MIYRDSIGRRSTVTCKSAASFSFDIGRTLYLFHVYIFQKMDSPLQKYWENSLSFASLYHPKMDSPLQKYWENSLSFASLYHPKMDSPLQKYCHLQLALLNNIVFPFNLLRPPRPKRCVQIKETKIAKCRSMMIWMEPQSHTIGKALDFSLF